MAHVPLPVVISTPEVAAAVIAAGFAPSAEKGQAGAAVDAAATAAGDHAAAAPSSAAAAREAARAKAKALAAIPIPGVKRVSSPWATPALAAVDTPTAEHPLPERPAPASGVFQGRPTPLASPVMLRGRRTRNGGNERRGGREEGEEEGGDQEKVVGGRRQLRRRPKSGGKEVAAASRLGGRGRRAPLGEAEQDAPDDEDGGEDDEGGPWTQPRVWDSGFVKEEAAAARAGADAGARASARRPSSDGGGGGGDENLRGASGSGGATAAAPKQKSNLGPARSLSANAAAAAAAVAAAAGAAAPGGAERGSSQRQQLSLLPASANDNNQVDESYTPVPALAAPRAPGVSAAQAVLLRRSLGGGGERVAGGNGATAARAAMTATAARPLSLHALPPASFKAPTLPAGLPVAVKPPSRAPSGLHHGGCREAPASSSGFFGAGAADADAAPPSRPLRPPGDGRVIIALTSVGDDVASLARAAVEALAGDATISSDFGSKEAARAGGDGGPSSSSSSPLPPPPPTHVVVGADRRTLKVLLAIAAGARLVTPRWLEACLEAREWLAPESRPEVFELGGGAGEGAAASAGGGGAGRFAAAAARARGAIPAEGAERPRPPLHAERVWVHVAPGSLAGATDPVSLRMVASALGAELAASPRAATLCVVAGGGAPPETLAPGAAAVGDEWLLLAAERWERPSRV